jgi:uncharacterized protein YcnI
VGIFRLRIGTAALGCAAATAATLGWSTPAAADVTVTPAQAVQGDAGRLTFRVANDSATASLTKVDLQFPASDPVAEVYPLSVPKWAPKITSRPLDESMPGLHGGRVTDTTSAISWTPAPGAELKPKGTVDLSISLGPLPATERLIFTVVQTYSDGTVNRTTSKPAAATPVTSQVIVNLLPATAPAGRPAPAAPGGHGHGTAPGANAAAPAAGGNAGTTTGNAGSTAAAGPAGTSWLNLGGWACAALAGGYALFAVRRGRRRQDSTAAGLPSGGPTPAPAGATATDPDSSATDDGTSATGTPTPATGGRRPATAGTKTAGDGGTAAGGGKAAGGSGKAAGGRMAAANTTVTSRGATGATGGASGAKATSGTATKDRSKADRSAGEPQRQPASAGRWTYRDRR